MGNFIAEIAIIKPLHNLFDYEIPNTFQFVTPGARVKVEFGKKLVTGFVINVKKETKLSNTKLKKIIEIIMIPMKNNIENKKFLIIFVKN